MAVRLTCTDNASGHDGLRWRMGETPESVDIVVGETAPGVGELVVSAPIEPEACFSVVAYAGGDESAQASVCADTIVREDFSGVSVGDEAGGGIYAGTDTISGISYHIIAGKKSSESPTTLHWKVESTFTDGASSDEDGLANTQAMEAAGIDDHPAAKYCINHEAGGFNDWHFPARNQVTLIYNALSSHPEFSFSGFSTIWSSTQENASVAYGRTFSDGSESGRTKASGGWVRPIRRVAA